MKKCMLKKNLYVKSYHLEICYREFCNFFSQIIYISSQKLLIIQAWESQYKWGLLCTKLTKNQFIKPKALGKQNVPFYSKKERKKTTSDIKIEV